ncbi:MAG: hypothetical protein ACOYMF_15275 [Bacteroidales bacterium]
MAHTIDDIELSPEERRYRDYMQKGDDFMKISIYRSAKEWYTKAQELNHKQELISTKLEHCNRLIQDEKKKIIVIVLVIAIGALALIFL